MKRNLVTIAMLLSVLALSASFFTPAASAGVFISVRIGPPALPVYAQPVCPGPGYIWAPGYWAWSDIDGYYWVPGTWVVAPVGMLWTPGYWGWNEGFYVWHAGYWGPHVGFYGGINYGFGYTGVGFFGGEWRGDRFYYNRSVTNVNVVNVTNVYNKTVIVNNTTINRVSYNGGNGGVMARPTREEIAAEREPHRAALPMQSQHERAASENRQLFASENHGRPQIAATARPAEFKGRDVIAAKAAGDRYEAPKMSPREARGPDQSVNRPGNVSSGRDNGNSGFRKFGEPTSNRPGNDRGNGRGNTNSWNNNVQRPGDNSNGRGASKRDDSFQKFGQQGTNRNSQKSNGDWRSNRPNGNNPRPVSQPMNQQRQQNSSRGPDRAQTQERPRPSTPPRANAPRPNESRPRENQGREPERHEGKNR